MGFRTSRGSTCSRRPTPKHLCCDSLLTSTRLGNPQGINNDAKIQSSRLGPFAGSSNQQRKATVKPRETGDVPDDSETSLVTNPYAHGPLHLNGATKRSGVEHIPSVTEPISSKSSPDSHFALPLIRNNKTAVAIQPHPSRRIEGNDPWRDFTDSSSLPESLTRKNMRELAAQIVRLEQRLGHIHSDKVYATRMEVLMHEERQRMIRDELNSSYGGAGLKLASHPYLQLKPGRALPEESSASANDEWDRGRTRDRESPRTVSSNYTSPRRDRSVRETIFESMEATEHQSKQPFDELQPAPKTSRVYKAGGATTGAPRHVGREHHVKFEDIDDEDARSQQTVPGPSSYKGKGKQKAVPEDDEVFDAWFADVKSWRDV